MTFKGIRLEDNKYKVLKNIREKFGRTVLCEDTIGIQSIMFIIDDENAIEIFPNGETGYFDESYFQYYEHMSTIGITQALYTLNKVADNEKYKKIISELSGCNYFREIIKFM